MKKALALMVLAFGLAACAGEATSPPIEGSDLDLTGLNLVVHQAPG